MNSRQKIVQRKFLQNEKGVIRRLDQAYSQCLTDIQGKVKDQYSQIHVLTNAINKLDKDDPQRAVLESQRQSKVYRKTYQEQLQRQISGILDDLHTKQYTTVNDYLRECYDDGFVGALYDLQGQGVPFMMPINQQRVVHAVQLESKISNGLYNRMGQDVRLLKGRITAQVSRSMVNGESWNTCANRLNGVSGIGKYNAMRIARTEGHRIQNRATMDVMEDAKEKGADVVKQWDATLDGRTRPTHIAVDGEIREVDEPFSNGLLYAGDPNGKASEVIHCRCATLQRARWALDRSFTKWDTFRDQLLDFNDTNDYNEFKKWYFSDENRAYMKYYNDLEQKYQTTNLTKLLEYMTAHEYDTFTKLQNASPMWKKVIKPIVPPTPTPTPTPTPQPRYRVTTTRPRLKTEPIEETFSDKIESVRRDIRANGGKVEERHLMEAGKIFRAEVDATRTKLVGDVEQARKKYETLNAKYSKLWDERPRDDADFDLFSAFMAGAEEQTMSEYDILLEKARQAEMMAWDAYLNAENVLAKYDKSAIYNKLSEIRSLGRGNLTSNDLLNGRSSMRKFVEQAFENYPTEWIEECAKTGTMHVVKVDRGYFNAGRREIGISCYWDAQALGTSVHELGHYMEHTNPTILQVEREFYARRTAGESLEWMGSGYRRDEVTRRDNFINEYMGKDYGGQAFELVSMGFQYAFTEYSTLLKDPDMCEWILGILAVV